jgi:phospholipid/cholesterol/gamma-HCH transport system permease protein
MNTVQQPAVTHHPPNDDRPGSPGVLAVTGQWTINQLNSLITFCSVSAAVLWQSCRLLTWRRTVRAEFFHQCHQVGTRALPFLMITALIVGLGVVFETLYWLKVFGQSELAGSLLVVVLVREIAPLLVALIIIGRSVSVIMIELGIMRADDQIRMLDAQGIDPFIYLLVPRVMAVSVCMFSLTIVFTVVTLAAGFVAGNALSGTNLTVYDFVFEILSAMGPADFATIPVTTLLIGFVTGLIGCTNGLSFSGVASNVHELLPSGIMKSVIATLLISVVVTLIL